MNDLLERVFEKKSFKNEKGEVVKIHSETSRNQCSFLQSIIRDKKFKNSIEIGFAFGTSTLAITEEIARNNGRHVVIDKFQNSGWNGNGLELIELAGYSKYIEFYEEYCYIILPNLLRQERKFDFAYIDSTKQFDWLLVDFFFLDKILLSGGIIVFDDVNYPGVRKLMRYIVQFPNYRLFRVFPVNRKLTYTQKVSSLLKYLPKAKKLIRENILKTDYELGINASCVAIEKISDDSRSWNWHNDF